MSRLWRVCKSRYADQAFSGEGARKHGGRWSPKGAPVVYLSETLSLALLEILVHVDPVAATMELVAIPVDVPVDLKIERIDEKQLPADWRRWPAPPELQALGASWLGSKSSALLEVPSALNPIERNVLLDPLHPDAPEISIEVPVPVSLDSRLLRGLR